MSFKFRLLGMRFKFGLQIKLLDYAWYDRMTVCINLVKGPVGGPAGSLPSAH